MCDIFSFGLLLFQSLFDIDDSSVKIPLFFTLIDENSIDHEYDIDLISSMMDGLKKDPNNSLLNVIIINAENKLSLQEKFNPLFIQKSMVSLLSICFSHLDYKDVSNDKYIEQWESIIVGIDNLPLTAGP
tara:strand:+ start:18 stop:407 length:390 start_codon:yes stop_codon:yes gene_type:complete